MTPPFAQLLQWLHQNYYNFHTNPYNFILLALTSFFIFMVLYNHGGGGGGGGNNESDSAKLPSPPWRLPVLGHLHRLGPLPHRSLWAMAQAHGPIMLLHLGRVPTVISSAHWARQVAKAHDASFAGRPSSRVAHALLYGARDVAFAPYGEYWRQVRRTCVLRLLSPTRVREEESALMVREIAELAELGAEFNVSELVARLTNDIVCRAAFGRKYGGGGGGGGGDAEGGVGAVREALAEFVRLLGTVQIGEFVAGVGWIERWWRGLDRRVEITARALDGFLERVLEDHRREYEMDGGDCNDGWGGGDDDDDRKMDGRDLVDLLLAVEKEDKELGVPLGQDSNQGDYFGTDTTYTTIEWAMAELINHPERMKKLQEEVRSVVGTDRMVLEEDLNNMAYLKAVIKESLRLHPPVPLLVPRETIEDANLMGYRIPAKTRVIINAWAIGRDSESWERPEEFWPERFMDSLIDYRGQDFQFIPFGAGRRGCPGINFAMSTAELALANLVHRFDWELPGRIKGERLDLSEVNGITVHLKSSIVLGVKSWCL